MRAQRRWRRQDGQVLVIAALMAVLIFGTLAIGVDLSVQTLSQRTLQNVADAGALAGATDLLTTVDTIQQTSAVNDALSTVHTNLGGAWSGGAPTPSACGSGECGSGTLVVNSKDYAVSVSTPPTSAHNTASNAGVNDLEVEISSTIANGFAGVIGMPASSVGAHAVAYHYGPPGPYDYTFFAKTETCSGNQPESIYGDAYVGGGFHPQCNGGGSPDNSALCVYEVGGDLGRAVFSGLPPQYGPDPSYGIGTPCSAAGGHGILTAQAAAPQPSPPSGCPSGATPETDPSTGTIACVDASPPVPSVEGPACKGMGPWQPSDPTKGVDCVLLSNGATINSKTTGGIYVVPPGGTATLDFSNPYNSGNIDCVSLELDAGASVSITNKKGEQYMTSYGYNPDSTSNAEIGALSSVTSLPTACPGSTTENPTDSNTCVICASLSSISPMPVALSNSTTGCCSDTLFVGTVFLPGQMISFQTNQAMEDVGQVYCGDWQVQSGNHPNPMVTRDVQNTDLQWEQLRLVE